MEVTIESLAAGGDGVAHAPDGRVVFVPFTAPGDRVRLRITESRGRFLRATVETLLAPGASRSDPVCPVFGSCGGCSWQHVSMEAQLEAKRRIVEDALSRLGGLRFAGEVQITASPVAYGYRARTRVLRHGGRTGYRRRRSHAIVSVTRCPVLTPELDASLHALAASREARDGEHELGGGELLVGEDRLRVSPGVFFQANAALHDALASAVLGAAGEGRNALEIFSGAGFFTLGLSRRFAAVTAVESDAAAVQDLHHNLAQARRSNVRVLAQPIEQAWRQLEGSPADPPLDLVLLDPPRTGLPPEAPERLAGLAPGRIVYLSCDPATLARDCARLGQAGYGLRAVEAFDLFPQTPHVEVLATLEASRGRGSGGSVHSGGDPPDRNRSS